MLFLSVRFSREGGIELRRGPSAYEVTLLLQAWGDGEREALDRAAPFSFRELHILAVRFMISERREYTLQATVQVSEASLCLVESQQVNWHDRAHFSAVCARAMRGILVDHALCRGRAKSSSGQKSPQLEESLTISGSPGSNLPELDDGLNRVAALGQRESPVVTQHFFGGRGAEETAEVLKISLDTAMREWRVARRGFTLN